MRFSIITPVYRGSMFLEKLYQSLLDQHKNFPDFEWILVDDFSNDNGMTKSEIEKITNSNPPFKLKVIFLEKNYYGSMSTYSGSQIAEGEYLIILDQDDFLSPKGLAIFEKYIQKYSHNPDFVGVCGRCLNSQLEFIGNKFDTNEVYSNELEVRHVLKIRGEMFQCTKTGIIREYFKGMLPGYTNGWAWSRISLKYKWLYTNEVVRHYDTGNPESHSNSKFVHYHLNWCRSQMELLSVMKGYVKYAPLEYFKTLLTTTRGLVICGCISQIFKEPLWIRALLLSVLPFGSALAFIAKVRKKRIYLANS